MMNKVIEVWGQRGLKFTLLYGMVMIVMLSGCDSLSIHRNLWTSDQVYSQSDALHVWDQWFAVPIIYVLDWFRSGLGSYVQAIFLIPILVHLLASRLIWKQSSVQFKIHSLQAEIQALQKEHQEDPVQLHKALREFYEKQGIGSFSQIGCLPLLVQAPFFFGLFQAISYYVPLREEAFFSVTLGQTDPYWILPGLAALSILGVQIIGLVVQGGKMVKGKSSIPWRTMLFSFTISTLIISSIMPIAADLYLLSANLAAFLQSLIFFLVRVRPFRQIQSRLIEGEGGNRIDPVEDKKKREEQDRFL